MVFSEYGHPYFRRDRPDLVWLIRRPSPKYRMSPCSPKGRDTESSYSFSSHVWGDYEAILQEVLPMHRKIVAQALMWILYSMRPLHTSELLPALETQMHPALLASELCSPPVLLDERLESKVLSYLNGLIEIDGIGFIRLRQQSVRDFLLAGGSREYWVQICKNFQLAHEILTQVSVHHLTTFSGMEMSAASFGGNWSPRIARAHHCPFCGYASVYWADHYREAESGSRHLPGFVHSSLLSMASLRDIALDSENLYLEYLLSFSARVGFTKLARIYLEMGVDLNDAVFVEGRSPLDLATAYGHTDIVKMFLERGSLVDRHCASHGQTPLMVAVLCGNIQVAHCLLQYGANVNAKNALGETPLHLAVAGGNTACVELLLSAGADPFLRNTLTKENALHLATLMNCTQIRQLLLRHDSSCTKGSTEYSSDESSTLSQGDDEQYPLHVPTANYNQKAYRPYVRSWAGVAVKPRTDIPFTGDAREHDTFHLTEEYLRAANSQEPFGKCPSLYPELLCQKLDKLELGGEANGRHRLLNHGEHITDLSEWILVSLLPVLSYSSYSRLKILPRPSLKWICRSKTKPGRSFDGAGC